MKRKAKVVIIALAGVAAMALAFPFTGYAKQTRAAFPGYFGLQQMESAIFAEPGLPEGRYELVLSLARASEQRVAELFGERLSQPTTMYVENPDVRARFSDTPLALTYYMSGRNCIVIGPAGLNEAIITHEFTHAELRERLHFKEKVPVWFDEGLAAMADGRYSASEAVWAAVTEDGKKPVDWSRLDTHRAFQPDLDSRQNYSLACYEVSRWIAAAGRTGLLRLIEGLNAGGEFQQLYEQIEQEASAAQP